MLSGWAFFKIWKAFNFHFYHTNYDIIKYNGKINVSEEKYGTRNDRYRFEYFGSKFHNRKSAAQFCIANFIRGNKDFIYQSYNDANSEYLQWRKIQDAISKVFSDDLVKIGKKINISSNIFEVTQSGNLPPLLQMMKVSFVTLETIVILNKETESFLDKWSELCNNDPYLKELINKTLKYQPFVKYDREKINEIMIGFKI